MSILSLIPPPYGVIGVGVFIVIVGTAGFYEGHHIAVLTEQAAAGKAAEVAASKYAAQTIAYNQIANELQVVKNEHTISNQAVSKVVTRIITRPVYHNVCIDSDGLSAVNAALAGQAPSTSGATIIVPPADAVK